MRYSINLCDEENEFQQKRKRVVFQAMRKLLGTRGPRTIDELNKRIVLMELISVPRL